MQFKSLSKLDRKFNLTNNVERNLSSFYDYSLQKYYNMGLVRL